MESFSLTWRFLLDHPATPYFAPLPWHLLVVLVVLGLLAAGGLHHLLGHRFHFYRRPGGTAGWLALPSFALLLVSVQVLIGIYLMAALAPDMVRFALASPAARASAMPIGNMLLAPAFAGGGGDTPQELNRAGLNRALHAQSPKELRANYRRKLDEARAQPVSIGEAPDWDQSASPELLMLALHWAAEDYQDWPPEMAGKRSLAREYGEGRGIGEKADGPTLSRSILSLVEEIGWESDMARRDWAHVAGNRFVQRVLGPMMVWQVRWLAVVSLIMLLAANLGALYLLAQLKRLVYPPPEEEAELAQA
jgi:hypothetical protein